MVFKYILLLVLIVAINFFAFTYVPTTISKKCLSEGA